MKKILAIALALTMIVGMSIVPAFAAAANTGDTAINVTANYVKSDAVNSSEVVYSIDVSYDAMTFTYTEAANSLKWNPETLDFDIEVPNTTGSWGEKTSANITVTNKSNAALEITAVATNGFTVTAEAECASAVGAGEAGANAATTATLVVTVPASITETTTAQVTVTIA